MDCKGFFSRLLLDWLLAFSTRVHSLGSLEEQDPSQDPLPSGDCPCFVLAQLYVVLAQPCLKANVWKGSAPPLLAIKLTIANKRCDQLSLLFETSHAASWACSYNIKQSLSLGCVFAAFFNMQIRFKKEPRIPHSDNQAQTLRDETSIG